MFGLQFEDDGYLILEDFVSSKDVEAMKKECWQIIEDMNPAEHHTVFSTTKHVRKIYSVSPQFKTLRPI